MANAELTVALAGNPNVGKSTVFNAITGLKQHTGNWTGKTVDLAAGRVLRNGIAYNFIDIPGTYSLKPHSAEEVVAGDYICYGGADVVVVVCDATCLEKSLYLALQIIETGAKVIVCVNLIDEADKKGISINTALLEKELGVRVVGMSARSGNGIDALLDALEKPMSYQPIKIKYNADIESALEYVLPLLKVYKIEGLNHRWLSLRLIENDPSAMKFIENSSLTAEQKAEILKKVSVAKDYLKKQGMEEKFNEAIATNLYIYASKIGDAVAVKPIKSRSLPKSEKIFTSRVSAYIVMLLMLSVIFYITIAGANYPSQLLYKIFGSFEIFLLNLAHSINMPDFLSGMLICGGFRVLGWVVSVMLPPMAIFFPCFTFLEDLGVLPRIAYVLDNSFSKANTCGKQALTTCMGYGCNCVGIAGARIIDSERERLVAILTNSLTLCNGRFPAIITLISIFLVAENGALSAFVLALVIVLGIGLTLVVSSILTKTLLKGEKSHYILELPPYRKPQLSRVIVSSVVNRTIAVLSRAVGVAFPAGVIIWVIANLKINNLSILGYINAAFEPLGRIMGLDGNTLAAFFIGIPANEIVMPVALMSYIGGEGLTDIQSTSLISNILTANGWTPVTAVCYITFSVVHFPCATALITVFKETKSIKWTLLSFVIPTVLGVILCVLVNIIAHI